MTLIVIILAVALAVWGLIYVLRGSLLTGCLAFLVAGCCFNEYFFKFDVGPITLTIERIVLAGLVGVYVIGRWIGRTDRKPLETCDLLLFGLLGYLVVSWITGDEIASGKDPVPPFWRLLAGYLMPACIYWIARQSALTEGRVATMFAVLTCFGLYLSVTGLLETAGQWALVFPRHIADSKLGLHFGRARGPMLQSVSYGLYVSICLLSAWIWRRRLGRTGRWLLGAAGPLFLAAIYFSYTRAVWLGAGLALFVVLGLTLPASWRKLVLSGMVAGTLLLALFRTDSFLSFQRESSASQTRDSAYLRLSFVYVSWQMFLDRPLMGCGLGRFVESKLPYLSDRSVSMPLEKIRSLVHHNHYLSLLTETGIIGVGLFLALMGAWTRNCWQMLRHSGTPDWIRGTCVLFLGTMCVFALQWLGHELSYSPIDHSLLFLLAGVTVGLRRQAFGSAELAPVTTLCDEPAPGVPGNVPVAPAV